MTNPTGCGTINTESEVSNIENKPKVPRRQSKKDLADALLKKLDGWMKDGDTAEEAVERLSIRQYDFLVDYGIDLDNLLLTPEQMEAVKEVKKATRTCKPGGYNKKYPQPKQNLFMGIVDHIKSIGGEIIPKEKENFRDLDFTLDGTHYKIVLSNPRK